MVKTSLLAKFIAKFGTGFVKVTCTGLLFTVAACSSPNEKTPASKMTGGSKTVQASKTAEEYFESGFLHAKAGAMETAIADFDTSLRLDSTSAKAHYNRGLALFLLGKFDKATSDFNAALRLMPDSLRKGAEGNAVREDLRNAEDRLRASKKP